MHILIIRISDLKLKYEFETEVEARQFAEELLLAALGMYGHVRKIHYSCLEELVNICRSSDISVDCEIHTA